MRAGQTLPMDASFVHETRTAGPQHAQKTPKVIGRGNDARGGFNVS